MNEQPQQPDRQPNGQPEGGQPLYKGAGGPESSYSGYDLTKGAAPYQQPPAAPQVHDLPPNQPLNFSWEASEYIHHVKSPLWYAGYVAVMLALLAIAYFLTHSFTFVVLVVVMAVALGVIATRPPRVMHYSLTDSGIQIEKSHYNYSDFRAFGIVNDGALYSVMLIPTKRFMPALSMYFVEEDGEKIIDILGGRIPMEKLHLDLVDQLMRKLRF